MKGTPMTTSASPIGTALASANRSNTVRIGVQIWPGGTPSYETWREAVMRAEDLGADAIFGYDHFHKPFVQIVDGAPVLDEQQPDVNNFEGWTALASWGGDHKSR
jgi:alkanesulfonate monooxygenase SsuD/methylene tetrahydromethanopterin reductase-like flavin-dependent oxidoreductase (luciferase family)